MKKILTLPGMIFGLFSLLCLSLPLTGFAANVKVGDKIAFIEVKKDGEIALKGSNKIVYRPWSTDSMKGKVQVFQYLAARIGIDKLNKPFTDEISKSEFPLDKFAVTTLINVDDALWGTGGLISSELKRNKKKHPHAVMVVDKLGAGLKLWDLKKKNCAVFVLDKDGTVLFFKEGALTDAEVKSNIALIKTKI